MGNKFLGAIIGFALGGPVGAAAGAAIGGFADQVKKNRISASQFEAMRQRINEAFEQEEATGVAMARLEERLGDEMKDRKSFISSLRMSASTSTM